MVKLEITSILDPGLKDESYWVIDCSTCFACDECNPVTSANCNQHVYLCVKIKNNTDAECEISCNYYLFKGGEKYYSSPIKTKRVRPGGSAIFFTHGIDLLGDLCDDYKASISAWIESCITTCELTCQTACKSSCQSACESSCQTSCKITCQTACKITCQETCKTFCQTGCKITCEETCKTTCQTICKTTCEETCKTTCQSTCEQTGCETTCEQTACENCETSCQETCQEFCKVVKQVCEEACEETCQLSKELKCPIAVVSYGTPLVDCLEPLRRIRRILPSLIVRIYYSDLHLKIARKLRRFLYPPLLILVKLINYISKRR